MNYWTLTFLILSFIDLSIYIVFSILNKRVIQNISSLLFVPFCNILCSTLIWDRLPDSFSIILLLFISSLFIVLTILFFKLRERMALLKLSVICFLLNLLLWLHLYKTSFYIFSPSAFCLICSGCIAILTFIVIFIFFGKHNFKIIFSLILFSIPEALLIFTAAVTFFSDFSFYSAILLLGSLSFAATLSLTAKIYKKEIFIEEKKENEVEQSASSKNKKAVITTIMITASQLLISASAVLMII